MNIPDQYHKMIVDEIKEVEKLCIDTKSPEDKLYFFSATYGIINRVMNFYFDPILVFMHQILQVVHQAFTQRLTSPNISGTVSSSIPNEFWISLISYLSELRIAFEKKDEDNIRIVLEKFSNLWYATSGNGFYLYLRGKLHI
jgi:hypothetical protein